MSKPTKGQAALIAIAIAVLSSPVWGPRIASLADFNPKEFATKAELAKEIDTERRVGTEVVKRIDIALIDIKEDVRDIVQIQRDIFNAVAPRRTDATFPWDDPTKEQQ